MTEALSQKKKSWCQRRESNSYPLQETILSRPCMPFHHAGVRERSGTDSTPDQLFRSHPFGDVLGDSDTRSIGIMREAIGSCRQGLARRFGEDSGVPQNLLGQLAIPLGERVTGWCGSTRRTAINSDASLDFGNTAACFQPALRSTISAALVDDDRLVAVLTAYSPIENSFNESHSRTLERLASTLVDRLSFFEARARSNPVLSQAQTS